MTTRTLPLLGLAATLTLLAIFLIRDAATASPSSTGPAADLARARASWDAQHRTSYRFSIERTCFCPQRDPTNIVVRHGRPRVSDDDWEGPTTVPELFKVIDRAIKAKPERLTVKYSKRGVPTSIYVDENKMIADEEWGFTVSGFSLR